MPDFSLNEKLIIDYLLGDLPEAETDRLDELSVTDDEFAEFLEIVENDLVDDYIRKELPQNKRDRFESYYLTTERSREKVAIARTLVRHADRTDISDQERKSIRPVGFAKSRAFQWSAIAAALVIMFLAAYLLMTNMQLQNQIAQMKEEHAALKKREEQLQREITQQRSVDQQRETELARTREQLEMLEKQLAETASGPANLFAFTLLPQQREISSITEVKIPAAAESVAVTLKLESDDFPMYKAVLKNPATDEILWQSHQEKSVNKTVIVKFPAKILKSKDYILEVSGIRKSGRVEIISGYPFHVVIQ
ncbi:MAG TPA: hypothetical protein VLH08_21095 [Acidobacteriota bacterium]|nr:hypothetical protein [Acidobacteriota bacterium]